MLAVFIPQAQLQNLTINPIQLIRMIMTTTITMVTTISTTITTMILNYPG
jgi:hypothetical protein